MIASSVQQVFPPEPVTRNQCFLGRVRVESGGGGSIIPVQAARMVRK